MQDAAPDFVPPVTPASFYTSIPTTISALQWRGDVDQMWDWTTPAAFYGPIPAEYRRAATPARLYVAANNAWVDLDIGEWVIRDDLGFYPCKDSVFRKKYRKLDVHGGYSAGPHILIQNGEEVRG